MVHTGPRTYMAEVASIRDEDRVDAGAVGGRVAADERKCSVRLEAHGVHKVPSGQRLWVHSIGFTSIGKLAASFSSISIPRPGWPFGHR